jgi:AraC-like DNA-binding protein
MRTSFTAYVCEVRLREAERLLLTTKKSVTEIAIEVGFSTASYFIDRFRVLHGVTPHQYRQDCLPSPRLPLE